MNEDALTLFVLAVTRYFSNGDVRVAITIRPAIEVVDTTTSRDELRKNNVVHWCVMFDDWRLRLDLNQRPLGSNQLSYSTKTHLFSRTDVNNIDNKKR